MDIVFFGNITNENCTNVGYLMMIYYLPVMYSTIFAVGVLGNVTSLLVYVTKVRPWTSNGIIMINLATTDLLYVLTMPFLAYYYARGVSWTMGEFMCRFVRFGFHFNLYGSILFLTCLAVFRYVAVVHPMQAARVKKKRWGLIASAITWILAAAQVVPMFNLIYIVEQDNTTFCLDLASNNPQQVWWYSWMLTALGFLLPLLVVSVCYTCIVKQLATGPHTQSWSHIRARRLIALVIVCFVVCFLPYHILRTLRIYTRRTPDCSCMMMKCVQAAYVVTRPVAALNSIFNLGLYTLAGDRFKQALKSLLSKKGDNNPGNK
ncbi:2-oxoglutarate receptor 1-like [Electrophorus electricus]|uniref:2-oxoglutarate receptor 1-like n=1 Tax=Electrophorus electricus TaxID=8005 RepID=UPI0015D0497E|nr:2-oxoglutarate receptor 1-like [Electrophorus electricus]